jgi:hypothetical protein
MIREVNGSRRKVGCEWKGRKDGWVETSLSRGLNTPGMSGKELKKEAKNVPFLSPSP